MQPKSCFKRSVLLRPTRLPATVTSSTEFLARMLLSLVPLRHTNELLEVTLVQFIFAAFLRAVLMMVTGKLKKRSV